VGISWSLCRIVFTYSRIGKKILVIIRKKREIKAEAWFSKWNNRMASKSQVVSLFEVGQQ